MDKGRVVEMGTHDRAADPHPHGLYAHLWAMQEGAAAQHTQPVTP
jgi:ABC-type multidrug transport system fused ATPase/permease subunit